MVRSHWTRRVATPLRCGVASCGVRQKQCNMPYDAAPQRIARIRRERTLRDVASGLNRAETKKTFYLFLFMSHFHTLFISLMLFLL